MTRILFRVLYYFLIPLLVFIAQTSFSAQVDFTTSGTFYVPDGVTLITVQVWGGGGGGGGVQIDPAAGQAGGGGGGAYASEDINVLPGQSYNVIVGLGGAGGDGFTGAVGDNGGLSSVSGPGGSVEAAGGSGGGGSTGGVDGAGGAGGILGVSGTTNYSGGNGAGGDAGDTYSGGGGGAGGTSGNGGNSSGQAGGSGAIGGGNGADGVIAAGVGSAGIFPGGGGSGAFGDNIADYSGGSGGNGKVSIISADPLIGISCDRHLSFGSFLIGGAGTVAVSADAAGNRTNTGAITLIGNNTGFSAVFSVSGASKTFTASWSTMPVSILRNVTLEPISIVFDAISYQDKNSAADTKVYIGGTLTLLGGEPAGIYSAIAEITVVYD